MRLGLLSPINPRSPDSSTRQAVHRRYAIVTCSQRCVRRFFDESFAFSNIRHEHISNKCSNVRRETVRTSLRSSLFFSVYRLYKLARRVFNKEKPCLSECRCSLAGEFALELSRAVILRRPRLADWKTTVTTTHDLHFRMNVSV